MITRSSLGRPLDAKVIVFMKKLPDGTLEANRVNAGRDGSTPPM